MREPCRIMTQSTQFWSIISWLVVTLSILMMMDPFSLTELRWLFLSSQSVSCKNNWETCLDWCNTCPVLLRCHSMHRHGASLLNLGSLVGAPCMPIVATADLCGHRRSAPAAESLNNPLIKIPKNRALFLGGGGGVAMWGCTLRFLCWQESSFSWGELQLFQLSLLERLLSFPPPSVAKLPVPPDRIRAPASKHLSESELAGMNDERWWKSWELLQVKRYTGQGNLAFFLFPFLFFSCDSCR